LNTTASSIADELADRERRKIVYNLLEKSDREADKKLFAKLSKTIFF